MFTIFILSTLLLLISNDLVIPEWRTIECYRAIGNSDLTFLLYTNAPRGPPFITTSTNIRLIPKNHGQIRTTNYISHYFLRYDGLCQNTFQVSTLGIDFQHYILDMHMFNGLKDEIYGEAHYAIESGFLFNVHKVFDQNDQFMISINFNEQGNDIISPSTSATLETVRLALESLEDQNENLCINTKNNGIVTLRPQYKSPELPKCPISRIHAEYTVRGRIVESSTFSAYGCGSSVETTTDLVLIRERSLDARLKFISECIMPWKDSSDFFVSSPVSKFEFSIPHIETVLLSDMATRTLPNHRIFLMNTNFVIQHCRNHKNKHFHKTVGSNITLHANEYEDESVTDGLKRKRLIHISDITSCQ